MNNFDNIKDSYIEARKEQKMLLIDSLNANGFSKEDGQPLDGRGGYGRSNYTSGKDIKEYDLSNWLWIECFKRFNNVNFRFLISFNALDIDPTSQDRHALFDRIGIRYKVEDKDGVRLTSQITNYELPLNDIDLKSIICLLNKIGQKETTKIIINNN